MNAPENVVDFEQQPKRTFLIEPELRYFFSFVLHWDDGRSPAEMQCPTVFLRSADCTAMAQDLVQTLHASRYSIVCIAREFD